MLIFTGCAILYYLDFQYDSTFWFSGAFAVLGFGIPTLLVSWNLLLLQKKENLHFKIPRRNAHLMLILLFSFILGTQVTEIYLNASTNDVRSQEALNAFNRFYKAHIVQVGKYGYGTKVEGNINWLYRFKGEPKIEIGASHSFRLGEWMRGYRWESYIDKFEDPLLRADINDYYGPRWEIYKLGRFQTNVLEYTISCRKSEWLIEPDTIGIAGEMSHLDEIIQDKVKLKSIIARIRE